MSAYSWLRYKKLQHNDTLYLIIRRIHENRRPIVSTWKEHLNCDLVLKGSDGFYYFLQEVTDIEYEELQQKFKKIVNNMLINLT